MSHSDDEQTTDSTDTPALPGDSDRDLEKDVRFLRRILRRTRRTRSLQAIAEGALWYVAILGAVVVTALLASGATGASVPAVPAWILIAGGTAATIGAAAAGVQLWRRRADLTRTARALQRAEPDFRNDIAAALEFADTLLHQPDATDRELGFSRDLAAAHIKKTVRAIQSAIGQRRHLGRFLPQRSLWPPTAAVTGSLTICVAAGFVAPTLTASTLRSPFVDQAAEESTSQATEPLVSDIRIEYDPPPYTDRSSRTDRYTTGHIEAVEGTEVTISARPLRPTRSLSLVIETDGEGRQLDMSAAEAGRRTASFVLGSSGSYTFRAETPEGEKLTDPTDRRIDVQPDKQPQVSITSHSGTVEVSPEDTLEIQYKVKDDFGIDSVKQSYSFVGADESTTKPISVPGLEETPMEVSGSFKLDLRQMSLRPKDSVKFHIRAVDNNERTGPSTGKSNPLVFKVSSPEDKHLENIEAQRKLVDSMVDLLGGYLERPIGERRLQSDESFRQVVSDETTLTTLADRAGALRNLRDRQSELLDRMKKLVETIRNDPLMGERNITLLDGLHEHLSELHRRGGDLFDRILGADGLPDTISRTKARQTADYAGDMESALETGTIQMMELIASQKMEAVKATAKDIEDLKNRLKRLLEKYKKTRDPELKEAIKREINRLRQRMAELTQRMQMQMRELPKQHLNKDALQQQQLQSDTKKMADKLSSLEKKLEEGDIDGALKALEQMDSNLASLNKSMDQQFSRAQPKGLSKLDKKVSELMNDVNELRSAEKKLEKETKKLRDQQAKRRAEQLKEMMKGETSKLNKKIDRQLEDLEEVMKQDLPGRTHSTAEKAKKSLEDLKQALDQRDLQQARDKAESAMNNLRTMDFNLGLSQHHSQKKSATQKARQRLDDMVPRGESISRKLDSLMKRANERIARPNKKELKRLAEQQRKIQKRARKLQNKISESGKEFPMLKQKLQPSLKKADEQMGQAQKRLEQGQPQGALDSERQALQQLDKLKRQMKRSVQRRNQNQRGGGTHRREEIDIPGKQEGESASQLRDEVMKNMKQKKLESYEQEIEDYYKSLVE